MYYTPNTRGKSIFFIYVSNILFAATAVLVGMLSDGFSGSFTTFCRFLVGMLIGFGQLAATRTPFRIVRIRPWLGRGVFGALGMTLYYVSIALGAPGRASLFNNSFPIFVAIIAICFLGEKVRLPTAGGIALAFAGIAFVLWDGAEGNPLADIAGIASGFFAGISYHFNKRASKTEHPVVIYLGVCLVGLAFNAFSARQLLCIDAGSALILVLAGLGGYYAQIALTVGLRDIDTTEGSIHTFAKIPLTVLGGALFFGERITGRFIAGCALLFAGIFLDRFIPASPAKQ